MKIHVKITIIVVENKEPYYFIIICKCKEVPLSLFSYQMLALTFDYQEQSSYCNVYTRILHGQPFIIFVIILDTINFF